ncbi:flagellar L-ring protein [Denitrovibrio acetiphilus DSM 12809]|uniref:Flagellar L-ring protein n=1 Tax=Denitrovibrio acetiphilus (strain DSM 12809 / NBRC 114555 / N2460) TaxID=522772 RepID=D4H4A8_DENA2|nr:flagellar basal body L-ring protein FlgH [Denitrovibrio acetiphilus]ADD69237.1 flagellar L-ring protein [Denitrovibrio acetiphilus DSM 12809]
MKVRILLMMIATALVFTGCAKKPDFNNDALKNSYQKELEEYKKQQEARKPSPSLWMEASAKGSLFLDYKGRHVGDIIIINIVESTSASNSNSTSTSKSQSASSTLTNLMGLPANLGVTNLLGTGNALDLNNSLDSSSSFAGNGSKTKADTIQGTIAARVTDVLPSGNLVIEGHRELIVDNEKQTITLSGIVRQKDLDASNTVSSTSIADAKIAYSGQGMLSDSNKPGWLMTLFNWIMPF